MENRPWLSGGRRSPFPSLKDRTAFAPFGRERVVIIMDERSGNRLDYPRKGRKASLFSLPFCIYLLGLHDLPGLEDQFEANPRGLGMPAVPERCEFYRLRGKQQ